MAVIIGGPGVPELVLTASVCTPVRCLGCRLINIGCEHKRVNITKESLRYNKTSPPFEQSCCVQVLQVKELELEHTAPRVETKKLTPPRTQSRSIRDYKSSNVALPDDGWPVAANELASGHKQAVERRCHERESRFARIQVCSSGIGHMQARVHLCMVRTRRVSMDGVNAISALPPPAWYRLFWPARRRILFAELVRLPPSNVACPGRQPI